MAQYSRHTLRWSWRGEPAWAFWSSSPSQHHVTRATVHDVIDLCTYAICEQADRRRARETVHYVIDAHCMSSAHVTREFQFLVITVALMPASMLLHQWQGNNSNSTHVRVESSMVPAIPWLLRTRVVARRQTCRQGEGLYGRAVVSAAAASRTRNGPLNEQHVALCGRVWCMKCRWEELLDPLPAVRTRL